MLRRFKPEAYEIVARNSLTLTGGDSLLRGGGYHSDEEKKRVRARLLEDLKDATESDAQFEQVKGIFGEVFPTVASDERFNWDLRPKRKNKQSDEKRISDSGMFPAYSGMTPRRYL